MLFAKPIIITYGSERVLFIFFALIINPVGKPPKGKLANSANLDQTPQGLHLLHSMQEFLLNIVVT